MFNFSSSWIINVHSILFSTENTHVHTAHSGIRIHIWAFTDNIFCILPARLSPSLLFVFFFFVRALPSPRYAIAIPHTTCQFILFSNTFDFNYIYYRIVLSSRRPSIPFSLPFACNMVYTRGYPAHSFLHSTIYYHSRSVGGEATSYYSYEIRMK